MAWVFNKEVVNKIQISKEQLFNDNKSYNKTFRTNMIQKIHGTNCWPDNVKKKISTKKDGISDINILYSKKNVGVGQYIIPYSVQ